MTQTETITVQRINIGYRVNEDEIVGEIYIAGNKIDFDCGRMKLEVTDWMIEGEYNPALLIEPTSFFTPKDQ